MVRERYKTKSSTIKIPTFYWQEVNAGTKFRQSGAFAMVDQFLNNHNHRFPP